MTSTLDPYAHGTPIGDHHSWVRPHSAPCPTCRCCTAALCQTATEQAIPCDMLSHAFHTYDHDDLSICPCAALPVAKRRLREAIEADPDNPENDCVSRLGTCAGRACAQADACYARRTGRLIQAARYATVAGLTAGLTHDHMAPDRPMLTIILPTGSTTWPLLHMGEDPDPMRYYLACGLPMLADVEYADPIETYRRAQEWYAANGGTPR